MYYISSPDLGTSLHEQVSSHFLITLREQDGSRWVARLHEQDSRS
jgi:hypothetical protein